MDSESKKSDLLRIIEHGTTGQKEKALVALLPELQEEGDFKTVSDLMPRINELNAKHGINAKNVMSNTSSNFFMSLNYDDARDSLSSLAHYLNDENTPQKEMAEDIFPLYAMINLYNRFAELSATHTLPDNMKSKFEEIGVMYDLIGVVERIIEDREIRIYKSWPEELSSAASVYNYVQRVLKGKNVCFEDVNEVNTLMNAKVRYERMKRFLDNAESGDVEYLELILREHNLKANTPDSEESNVIKAESNVINALMPYAALMKVSNELKSDYPEYEASSEFEKNSKLYTTAARHIPVFLFEKIRKKISTGLTSTDESFLFGARSTGNYFVKVFVEEVQRQYIDELCKKNGI